MDLRSIATASPARATEIVPVVAPVGPATIPGSTDTGAPSTPLEPAVQVDLSPAGQAAGREAAGREESTRFARDPDSKALVFQVVDQTSGDVVEQLPDESVLRARAFARELAARAGTEGGATPSRANPGGTTNRIA